MSSISEDEQPTRRLAGKVIVVTGAARGQGAAEARALARAGATVVATDAQSMHDLPWGGPEGRTYDRWSLDTVLAGLRVDSTLRRQCGSGVSPPDRFPQVA